jgi:TDG/mug DNA glycosylase family protein
MGAEVETLADLLSEDLRAVSVGINPSLVSVAAGHYYQGRLGQRFWQRLRKVGLLDSAAGFEDDAAFAAGLGFTDIIKRPTASAKELSADEFAFGRHQLESKIKECNPGLVIFTFKKTAVELCGPFDGYGFVGLPLAGIESFVMPGPYEPKAPAEAALNELKTYLSSA